MNSKSGRLSLIHRCTTLSLTALASLFLYGCAVDIPQTDTTPPEVHLDIRGPSIGRQVMSNPPRSNWTGPGGVQLFDLDPGETYQFFFRVTDAGGVRIAQLRLPRDFEVIGVDDANVTVETGRLITTLTYRVPRGRALRLGGFNGRFRTSSSGLSFEFRAIGHDFGGASGRSNASYLSVNASVDLLR